jgi:hypothetical protein
MWSKGQTGVPQCELLYDGLINADFNNRLLEYLLEIVFVSPKNCLAVTLSLFQNGSEKFGHTIHSETATPRTRRTHFTIYKSPQPAGDSDWD